MNRTSRIQIARSLRAAADVLAAEDVDPMEYRAEYGDCPDGYHWDGETCVEVSKPKDDLDKSIERFKSLPRAKQEQVRWKALNPGEPLPPEMEDLSERFSDMPDLSKKLANMSLADQRKLIRKARDMT